MSPVGRIIQEVASRLKSDPCALQGESLIGILALLRGGFQSATIRDHRRAILTSLARYLVDVKDSTLDVDDAVGQLERLSRDPSADWLSPGPDSACFAGDSLVALRESLTDASTVMAFVSFKKYYLDRRQAPENSLSPLDLLESYEGCNDLFYLCDDPIVRMDSRTSVIWITDHDALLRESHGDAGEAYEALGLSWSPDLAVQGPLRAVALGCSLRLRWDASPYQIRRPTPISAWGNPFWERPVNASGDPWEGGRTCHLRTKKRCLPEAIHGPINVDIQFHHVSITRLGAVPYNLVEENDNRITEFFEAHLATLEENP